MTRWDQRRQEVQGSNVQNKLCNNNPLQIYVCVFDPVTVLKKHMGHKCYEATKDLLKCHHCTEQELFVSQDNPQCYNITSNLVQAYLAQAYLEYVKI